MRDLLACPSCKTKLMKVTGYCKGVIIICLYCGVSVLADIDEERMRLSIEPLIERP